MAHSTQVADRAPQHQARPAATTETGTATVDMDGAARSVQFADDRPEGVRARRLRALLIGSSRVKQLQALGDLVNRGPRAARIQGTTSLLASRGSGVSPQQDRHFARPIDVGTSVPGVLQGLFMDGPFSFTPIGRLQVDEIYDYLAQSDRAAAERFNEMAIDLTSDFGDFHGYLRSLGVDRRFSWEREGHPGGVAAPAFYANKGRFTLAEDAEMLAEDSEEEGYMALGTQVHRDLRARSLGAFEHVSNGYTGSGHPNVMTAAVTITYRTQNGGVSTISYTLPHAWNSGLEQLLLDFDGDESEAVERGQGVDFGQNLTTWFSGQTEQDVPEDINFAPKGKSRAFTTGINRGKNSSLFAHSETAMASDPQLNAYFQRVFEQFAAFASTIDDGVTVLNVTLDVDSYPNTVCTNACRHAVGFARALLQSAATSYFGCDTPPLSGRFGCSARVSAARVFQDLQNPAHRDLQAGNTSALASTDPGPSSIFELRAGGAGDLAHRQAVREFQTWAEARYSILRAGELIRITNHQHDISERVFRVTQDYDPSDHEYPPDVPPVQWINR